MTPQYLASLSQEDRDAIAAIKKQEEEAAKWVKEMGIYDDGKALHIKKLGVSVPRRYPGEPLG